MFHEVVEGNQCTFTKGSQILEGVIAANYEARTWTRGMNIAQTRDTANRTRRWQDITVIKYIEMLNFFIKT